MIAVYHGPFGVDPAKLNFMEDYNLVAIVLSDDKEKAFEFTNHIEGDWQCNQDVLAMTGPHRSTSVGDIMVDSDYLVWLVAPMGFECIGYDGL